MSLKIVQEKLSKRKCKGKKNGGKIHRGELWNNFKRHNMHIVGMPEGGKRENRSEEILM